MLLSYHVHSSWSDGQADIPGLIHKAREIGLDEIGISDHYVLAPGRPQFNWSMGLDSLGEYVDAVQSAAGEAGNMIVRLGLEVDYIPGMEDDLHAVLASHPFDFVIGSVHLVDGFLIDYSSEGWDPLDQAARDDMIGEFWNRVRLMAESGLFDFAGHFDLIKKFGIRSSVDMTEHIEAALDAVGRSDMALELNTSGWYMPCAEEYPEPRILRGCIDRGIPLLVSADAHTPANLIRGFDRAFRLLYDLGVTELVRYAGRQRFKHPLPDPDELVIIGGASRD